MKLAHRVEGAAARVALHVLRALGPVRASNLGGGVARAIGPLLPVSRVAHVNLQMALPALDRAARRAIVRGVWDNLGRTVGELPHVGALRETAAGPGWELAGGAHLDALTRHGGPGILVSGHIGNWEVVPLATATRGGGFATFYRAADNPLIDRIVLGLRREAIGADGKLFAKGPQGARQALVHLKHGGYLGFLNDQKMNDGIESRFFGRPAATAPALAVLALRLRCPVVPTYAQRLAPARFRVTFEAPIPLPDTGDRAADVAALTQAVNDRLEAWIRARPESWLWLHRRWPKQDYAAL